MEKFRSFEDPTTGIMPFMPPPVVVSKNPLFRLVRGIFSLAFTLIRLPLATVALLLLLPGYILAMLTPVAGLRRMVVRVTEGFVCRLILLILGFFWIPAGSARKNTVTVSKGGSKKTGTWPSRAGAGTVIVASLTSYLDILYLTFRFSPVYAFPVLDPTTGATTQSVLWTRSLFTAVRYVCSYYPADKSQIQDIATLVESSAKNNFGPIVLFAEGVSSNGRGILPFLPPVGPSEGSSSSGLEGSPWVGGDSAAPPCFALIIRYPCKNFSPSYSVGSFVWHLFNLCSQVYNTMEVVFVDERISELKASDQGLAPSTRGAWAEKLRTGMLDAACTQKVKVRAVVPRSGVTNQEAGSVLPTVKVKRLFADAYAGRTKPKAA
mmetsp:Transcript_7650/g.18501  ORF Transcript_7650/g.18501 Transcript_7650/m.18501 type:complete len:378 (-) Transcript_7650:199-1332(-)